MKPLITISIPIYKCERFLENCLKSVHNQSYQELEVILVNDCTPDNSVTIAEQFISKNNLGSSWSIIHLDQNSGLSVVRNTGINQAKGKYIFFLDSDDEITSDCIAQLVDLAEKENLQLTVGFMEAEVVKTKEKKNIFPIVSKENIILGNDAIFSAFINGNYPVSSCNKLILLDFLRKNNLYFTSGLFAQDSLQSFETALFLESIGFVKTRTYTYYLHQDSVIHNRNKKNFDNWITIATIIDGYLNKEKNIKRKKQILGYLVNYKNTTLLMNWKAQRNEELWKYSYNAYKKLSSFSSLNYFSKDFSTQIKKLNFLQNLPTEIGLFIFKKRFGAN